MSQQYRYQLDFYFEGDDLPDVTEYSNDIPTIGHQVLRYSRLWRIAEVVWDLDSNTDDFGNECQRLEVLLQEDNP